jgi:hypothetical protein
MDLTASYGSPDTPLARTALALVISSMMLPFIAALAVVFASSPAQFISDNPTGALYIAIAAVAYDSSVVVLYRLRRPDTVHRLRLWFVSLVATLAVVVTYVAAFGALFGSLIGVVEIVAAAVHLRAIVVLA